MQPTSFIPAYEVPLPAQEDQSMRGGLLLVYADVVCWDAATLALMAACRRSQALCASCTHSAGVEEMEKVASGQGCLLGSTTG